MIRKVIQITAVPGTADGTNECLYALCDDGTIWELTREFTKERWKQVRPLAADDMDSE